MSDIVKLNVGGVSYATSRTTLTAYPDSMLGRMFGGELPTATDGEGRYFIDRDGPLFRFVLNFLRTGKLSAPDSCSELEQLKSEADFFQVEPFTSAVSSAIAKQNFDVTKGVRSHCLEVLENISFPYPVGIPSKTIVLIGKIDVIKSLPITLKILIPDSGHSLSFIHMETAFSQSICNGDYVRVLLQRSEEMKNRRDLDVSEQYVNLFDLADILVSAGCELISSISELDSSQERQKVIRCCDRWFIPQTSLETLANIPKPI